MRRPLSYVYSLTVFSLLVALVISGREKPKQFPPTPTPTPTPKAKESPEPIADPTTIYIEPYTPAPIGELNLSRYRNH